MDHLNTGPLKVFYSDASVIQMLPFFRCFRYSDVRYSDPHCTSENLTNEIVWFSVSGFRIPYLLNHVFLLQEEDLIYLQRGGTGYSAANSSKLNAKRHRPQLAIS